MVAWIEYKEMAKKRGSLALELFVVESVPDKTPEFLKENLSAHLAYQRELELKGTLVLAGPVSDPTGENMIGAGLMIYRASSLEEARSIAAADPMHKSGARIFTLRKWLVNEGNLSINVGLSTGTVSLN